jgi:hypothetical protein
MLHATAITIDSSENVGIGVTPSAWGANYAALQSVLGLGLWSTRNTSATILGSNAYNANEADDRYVVSYWASKYTQVAGEHNWYTAPSGTAGDAITYTNSMTIDASGVLSVPAGYYVGGTGAANHLDDYEEGTWTPTGISAGTLDFARYTKIGDVVFLYLNVSGSITLTNGTIGGLPFSAVTTSCPWYFADFAVGAGEIPMPTIAGTNILLRTADQATGAISTLGDLTGSYISITATYHV